MKKQRIVEKGCTWMFYPSPKKTDRVMIVAIGGGDHNLMVKGAAKYYIELGCDVLAIGPTQFDKKYTGYHSFPLEYIEIAIQWLKNKGYKKIGMVGGSTTGMLALLVASYLTDLSLVLAYSPGDFVMEGFYRGKKKGYIPEWPSGNESTVSYHEKPIPFSPFSLSDEEYYDMTFGKSTKEAGEINTLPLFKHVEAQQEFKQGLIQVENIKAVVYAFGAEDDTLWETTKYIKRIEERLKGKDTSCRFYGYCYEKGTHFVFPQNMIKAIIPFGIKYFIGKIFKSGKVYPKECEMTRIDIDRLTKEAIHHW